MKNIYAIMYAYYSDWHIYGYFTNREDADKYCVAHPKGEYHVEVIPCFDGKEDLSNITLKYEHEVVFDKNNNSWNMRDEPERYQPYVADYLRSNSIENGYRSWISIKVNITKDDRKLAEKIAQDMLYQFLDFCDNKPTDILTKEMNNILAAEEIERSQRVKEEEMRVKELAELERLKAKYENTT